ncbi:MAG TPA: hypothetical protein IAB01_02495 [Candidatus Avidesulfovibrio excrementigallinarum]|nr:hypothetical protein [Candidatus Avidesulfovibrio excrementigallinarum]
MPADHLAVDAKSARTVDENGFLYVAKSHISKETVKPYPVPHTRGDEPDVAKLQNKKPQPGCAGSNPRPAGAAWRFPAGAGLNLRGKTPLIIL